MSDGDARKILGEASETLLRLKDFAFAGLERSDAWPFLPAVRSPSPTFRVVQLAADSASNRHGHHGRAEIFARFSDRDDQDSELERAVRGLSLELAELKGALPSVAADTPRAMLPGFLPGLSPE